MRWESRRDTQGALSAADEPDGNGGFSASQINLSWAASVDNIGVAGYQVLRNGSMVATPRARVYGDTNLAAATTYNYAVAAFDAAGNTSTPSAQTLATTLPAPVPDTNPPVIAFVSPTNGSLVAGLVTVSVNATDDVAVAGVQFKLDGANLGAELTALPYQTVWNSASAANGPHTLTGTARDTASNSATASVTVMVSNTVPVQGLVTYWTFDEGSGTTANDSSGSGNKGTLFNTPTWTTGKLNGALSFQWSKELRGSTPALNLAATRAVTVALWVNRTYSNVSGHALFADRLPTTTIQRPVSDFSRMIRPCAAEAECSSACMATRGTALKCYAQPGSGVWHHLAVIFDKSQTATNEVSLYVDGVLQTAQSQAYSGSNNTNNFASNPPVPLMSRAGTSEYAAGILDDFRVYNRALSAAEVQQLAAMGTQSTQSLIAAHPATPIQIVAPSEQNGRLVFTITGESGSKCAIEASADLENWSQIDSTVLVNGTAQVSELLPGKPLFYRIRLLP